MFTHAFLLISLVTPPTQPLSGAAIQASTADLCVLAEQTATRPAGALRDIVAIARVAERLPAAERAAAALAAIHVGLASGEPEIGRASCRERV